MRTLVTAILCVTFAALISTQEITKRILLSPKSNIDTSQIVEGFAKYCPNVVMTENESKADYVLEAAKTISAEEGTASEIWHFTLMDHDGDVLMTTDLKKPRWGGGGWQQQVPEKPQFEAVCKFINKTK
jgi:hypothetical protein